MKPLKKPLKIAVEYEKGLHNLDGTVANLAPLFLSSPLNCDEDGKQLFQKEATDHMVESNSPPRDSLDSLCLDMVREYDLSRKIASPLNALSIPISENGAGESKPNPDEYVQGRLMGYKVIFGEEMVNKLTKISGIHFHIDQYRPRLADQYNLLLALVPTIALTSTSSISHEGTNSQNCHRYRLFADTEEGIFSKIPEEKGYIEAKESRSIGELLARDRRRYDRWKREFDTEVWRHPDVPEDHSFAKYFKPHNTGYSEVRYRPDMGNGTFELRFNDSAPADILMGQAALVWGYVSRIFENDIPVSIAKDDDTYKFTDKEVVLPNKETLYKYAELGIENEEVRKYLSSIENFARRYLEGKGQQHYLDPIGEIIDSGRNIASQILDHLGHKHTYSPQEAARANLFVHGKNQQGAERLRRQLEYVRK